MINLFTLFRGITNLVLHGGDIVSLDIGKRYTKMVQVDVLKDGFLYLKRAVTERTPLNIYTQNGMDITIATEFINSLFRQNRVRAGSVVVSLDKPYVMLRTISIPDAEKENVDVLVRDQLKDSLPFDISTVSIDYHLYNTEKGLLGVVGIVKREVMEDLKRVARRNMVLVRAVDIGIIATLNAFVLTTNPERGKTYVVINGGYSNTDVIITDGWLPVYIRTIDYGLENIIRVAGSYDTISINDIESALFSAGTPQKNKYIVNILADGIQVFIKKIKNVIIDYSAQVGTDEITVESVLIFGGIGYIVELMAGDGSQLDFTFKVKIPNVFSAVDRTNSKTERELPFYSIYSTAMGSLMKELVVEGRVQC